MSFQKAVYGGGYTWAGWRNYTRIIHDPMFWQAWRNTLEFTLLALVIGYAVPFCVAILLNELRHARGYLRSPGVPASDAAASLGAAAVRLLL